MEDPVDVGGESWTEVASCTWLHQAELLRSVLDAAGIPVQIPDEQTLGVQPLYANLLGGARVLVPASDLDRARELLNTAVAGPVAAEDPEVGRSR